MHFYPFFLVRKMILIFNIYKDKFNLSLWYCWKEIKVIQARNIIVFVTSRWVPDTRIWNIHFVDTIVCKVSSLRNAVEIWFLSKMNLTSGVTNWKIYSFIHQAFPEKNYLKEVSWSKMEPIWEGQLIWMIG